MSKWIICLILISGCQLGAYNRGKLADKQKTKLCFIGDVGRDSPTQGQVAEALKNEKCHGIYFAGDIIYPGGLGTARDQEAETKFFKYYRPLTTIDNQPKLHIALGNHDYHNNPDVWTDIARREDSVVAPARYYFQDLSPVCIVILDTEPIRFNYQFFRNQGQLKWIKEQKKTLKENCKLKIAIGHHPYFNSKTERGHAKRKIRSFLDDHVIGEFDFYIAGHDHVMSYEGARQGTELFITGAGGTPHEGHRAGYMTMEIDETPGKLKVQTAIKELSATGEVLSPSYSMTKEF